MTDKILDIKNVDLFFLFDQFSTTLSFFNLTKYCVLPTDMYVYII